MKRILLTAIALVSLIGTTRLHAERLELKDLTSGKYTARRIYGVHPLADGERYSQLSQDARQIVAYSFRNGQQTGVLLDVGQTRGQVKIDRIDGYIMSPDEKNILVRTQTKSIYRRSHTGVYYIYNMLNRTLTPLSDGGPQECPVWSPDGYMVAFVREGNIYLVKLLYNNSESQVTKDGEFNKVINGKPDWVYEEEFVTDQSLTFTSDNTMLCWIRYDESDVPLFSFPWYKGLNPEKKEYLTYPGQYEYKYPMAGEQNSRVSVLSYDIKSHQTRTLQVPLDKDGYIPRIFATSDATKLAVVTLNRHQDRMDIYMANPRSTEARLVVRDQVEHYIGENAYGQINFVDGGFFMTSERDGWNHVSPAGSPVTLGSSSATVRLVHDGPCRTEFEIVRRYEFPRELEFRGNLHERYSGVAESAEPVTVELHTFVALNAGSDVLEVRTELDNPARDYRLRLAVPTGMTGKYFASQSGTFLEREPGREHGTLTDGWFESERVGKNFDGIVGKRDDAGGLALLSKAGLHEAGGIPGSEGELFVTLLRAFRRTVDTDGETEGQLNKRLVWEYALKCFPAADGEAELRAALAELRTAPVTHQLGAHLVKNAPDDTSFLELDGNLSFSCLKPAADGEPKTVILRLLNPSDEARTGRVRFALPFRSVRLARLDETETETLAENADKFEVSAAPRRWVTLKIRF